jgi:glycosidase
MKNSTATGDLAKRAPMDWDAEKTQDADHSSILNFFRALGRMRNAQTVLNSGTVTNVSALGTAAATYLRVDNTVSGAPQHALVILNFGDQPLAAQTFTIANAQNVTFKVIWGNATATWSKLRKKLVVSPIPAKSGTVITY